MRWWSQRSRRTSDGVDGKKTCWTLNAQDGMSLDAAHDRSHSQEHFRRRDWDSCIISFTPKDEAEVIYQYTETESIRTYEEKGVKR